MARRRFFDRTEFIEINRHRVWKQSEESRAIHLNAGGVHMAVMTDHNDRSVWTWVVTGKGDDKWSPRKYRTQEEAQQGALEETADRIERELQGVSAWPNIEADTDGCCERCGREILEDDPGAKSGLCGECNAGWTKANSPD